MNRRALLMGITATGAALMVPAPANAVLSRAQLRQFHADERAWLTGELQSYGLGHGHIERRKRFVDGWLAARGASRPATFAGDDLDGPGATVTLDMEDAVDTSEGLRTLTFVWTYRLPGEAETHVCRLGGFSEDIAA